MTLFIRCPSPDVAKLHLFWGEITPLTPFIRPFIGVITPFYNHPKGPTLYFFPKGKNAWIFSKSYIELTHSADFTLAKRGVSFEFLLFFSIGVPIHPKKASSPAVQFYALSSPTSLVCWWAAAQVAAACGGHRRDPWSPGNSEGVAFFFVVEKTRVSESTHLSFPKNPDPSLE